MLTVDGLHTYYDESHVLQGVSLTAARGAVTAVLGRNGVGKTTLCRSLVGLTPARAGHIRLDGVDITRLPPHRIHRLGVSLVPQGRHIFPSLTVRENLAIAMPRPAGPWDFAKVCAVFPRLAERSGHRGNELSGGEQQMLAIARALVANPRLMLLDEPSEGLAPLIVRQITDIIVRLKQAGMTMLLVEQNFALATEVADRIVVLGKGRVRWAGTAEELRKADDVRHTWLGE